jgi:protein gp37
MSDGSRIEWTEATWNPVTGCTKVSQGCKHCYAERDWKRLSANPKQPVYLGRLFTDVQCHPARLTMPIEQARPRRIFVNSMSDLFHEDVPFEFIDQVFAVMACTCRHTYQVLTKRPERMLEYFASRCSGEDFDLMGFPGQIQPTEVWPQWVPCRGGKGGYDNCGPTWPLINVCLGVSIEDQETANERIPLLLQAPAAVRFISAEPLLGPVDLRSLFNRATGETWDALDRQEARDAVAEGGCGNVIDWVIAGGESGPHARPTHVDWVRSLRDQCDAAGTAFFFKQWGEHAPAFLDAKADEVEPWRRYPNGERVWALDEANRPRDQWPAIAMHKIGKKAAGRVLDGRVHDEQPKRTPWPVD